MKKNDALFYTCSLIEYIGRQTKNRRIDVIECLGDDLGRIYSHADVFHCEPIEKVADDFITRDNIISRDYDTSASVKYPIPDYWDIGEVFERLIEDNYSDQDVIQGIKDVYGSWIADKILNFNSDLYYQPRDYISECYRENRIIPS